MNEQSVRDGSSLLQEAISVKKWDIAMDLVQRGINVNIQDNHGNTALHYAISYKHFDIVNLLINNKADETIRNSMKKIPWECSNINPEEDNL